MNVRRFNLARAQKLVASMDRDALLNVEGLFRPAGTLGSNSDGDKSPADWRDVTVYAFIRVCGIVEDGETGPFAARARDVLDRVAIKYPGALDTALERARRRNKRASAPKAQPPA